MRLGTDHLPRIIDTDYPNGTIVRYFPEDCDIIDLSSTDGQIRLFDNILENPQLDHVIDLEAYHLQRFFSIFEDIGYNQAAADAGMGVAVFYFLDRTLASIQTAIALRKRLTSSQFILVRNDAIGAYRAPVYGERELSRIDMDRQIRLPVLSTDVLDFVEDPAFNLTDFIMQRPHSLPDWLTDELWSFLEEIYEQQPIGTAESMLSA
ncbi:hypothetical protein [Hoeflea sp. TYP-13]|uniref:hypothetical protein n=1 Tax=Hoeflea sp. TYP-13 TaxID=3230023 RepID=UPI0034C5BC41